MVKSVLMEDLEINYLRIQTMRNKKEQRKELFKISLRKYPFGGNFTMVFKTTKETCFGIH